MGIALPLAVLVTMSGESGLMAPHSDSVDHRVAVTEAYAGDRADGCAAISILQDDQDDDTAFRGPYDPSLSWLAADASFATILASTGNANTRFLYRLRQAADGTWHKDRVQSRGGLFTFNGIAGLAIGPDNRSFIVQVLGIRAEPYALARFRLPDGENPFVVDEDVSAYAVHDYSAARQLLLSPEGQELVALTDSGMLFTHHLPDLSKTTPPIQLPPIVFGSPRVESLVYGALSPGGRYLSSGRGGIPELVFVDRTTSVVTRVDASRWLTMTGDVAFNAGWSNNGLLAVHGGGRIGVFQYDPVAQDVEELSSVAITAPRFSISPYPPMGGPIAWSGDGSRVIAGVNHGTKDFAVYGVSDCGSSLMLEREWAVCPASANFPVDILTANGRLPTPVGWRSSCPTPMWNDAYTPGPFVTATPTPTEVPFLPWKAHLPAAIRDSVVILLQ